MQYTDNIIIDIIKVLAAPGYGVMLRQECVSTIVTAQNKAYYRPLLFHDFCHFSGGEKLKGGPICITSIQAYDMASHIYKGDVQGAHYLIPLLGKKSIFLLLMCFVSIIIVLDYLFFCFVENSVICIFFYFFA